MGSAIILVPSLALAELVLENFSLKVFSLKFRKKKIKRRQKGIRHCRKEPFGFALKES